MDVSGNEVDGKGELKFIEERVGDLYDLMRAIKCLSGMIEEGADHRIELAIAIRHLSIRAQDFINDTDVAVERAGAVLQ